VRRRPWRTTALRVALLLGAACFVGALALYVRRATPPPLPAPDVFYAGCAGVLSPGPVCVLEPARELCLWMDAPPGARIDVLVDGSSLTTRGEVTRGGRRFSLSLAPGARRVEVRFAGREPWVLGVAEPGSKTPAGSRDVYAEVRMQAMGIHKSIDARDFAAARSRLAALRLPPRSPAKSRINERYYRGVLAEREGDYRSALQELQAALEIAKRVKLSRESGYAEQVMALLLRDIGRSAESAQLFEHLRSRPEAEHGCARGLVLGNQAWSELLAREAGENLGDPVSLLEEALATYEACKATPRQKSNILINLALADLLQGQGTRVRRLLERADDIDPHPLLPQLLLRLDLTGRLALREQRPTAALRAFAELDNLAAQTGSFDNSLHARFGEATAHQALGQQAKALATLVAAERLLDEQSLRVPITEGRETFVAARQSIVSLHLGLLLDQGRTAEALETARRARVRVLRQLAQADRLSALPPDQRDRRSRLLSEYQQRRTALEERAQDDWKLPIDQRRQEEAARRAEAEAAQQLLDDAFLLLGEPADQPLRAQPAVRRGEVLLVYYPLGEGWVGFAADVDGVVAHRFELPPEAVWRPEQLATLLLSPFRSRIERAGRIRILASGRLEAVDFHALPFGGDVLVAGRPVIYGLDLGAAPLVAHPGRRALLVANPGGDLHGAAAEGVAVRKALRSARPPWATEELTAANGTEYAVATRLGAVDLFHFAGHGAFAGLGGWDSSLRLAKENKLTVGDLLSLDRLPAWVMLSGCETGRSAAEVPVAGIGLAQAFLLAGSKAVVASTRPADDRTLPDFFVDLYGEWQGEPDDLAAALQGAQLAWRKQDSHADWASFRLFEP